MTRCRHWKKHIPEAVYRDLDPETREKLERHLAVCKSCAEIYSEMAALVRKMDVRPAPDRPAEFWESYWDRLEERMAHEAERSLGAQARNRSGAFQIPRWAYGAVGAVVLLALGIFIGRTFLRPREDLSVASRQIPSVTAPGEQRAVEAGPAATPLAVQASRYLKRSRTLLLAVINSDPRDGEFSSLSLPLQKKTSNELLQEATVLKKGLGSSDRRLERLVSDLEMILLQIANLKSDSGTSDVEIIRAGIESKDILFKINLSEIRRSAAKSGPGQGPGSPGGSRVPSNVKTAAEA
jgi:hypothetical protein